jgi:hypothetical protein
MENDLTSTALIIWEEQRLIRTMLKVSHSIPNFTLTDVIKLKMILRMTRDMSIVQKDNHCTLLHQSLIHQ